MMLILWKIDIYVLDVKGYILLFVKFKEFFNFDYINI